MRNIANSKRLTDTHIPQLLRDAQVLPIWEGTSTVMSLDVLRAIQTSKRKSLNALISSIKKLTSHQDQVCCSYNHIY